MQIGLVLIFLGYILIPIPIAAQPSNTSKFSSEEWFLKGKQLEEKYSQSYKDRDFVKVVLHYRMAEKNTAGIQAAFASIQTALFYLKYHPDKSLAFKAFLQHYYLYRKAVPQIDIEEILDILSPFRKGKVDLKTLLETNPLEEITKKADKKANLNAGIRRIIIDPGHGGSDPGAVGKLGTQEKDLTLKIARWVAAELKKRGFVPLLTRNRDRYLSLEDRTAFGNARKGDLFISIHVNANPGSRLSGIETYYLNITNNSYALRLAHRENRYSRKTITDLQYILTDLSMNSYTQLSAKLAGSLQRNIVDTLRKTYTGIEDQGVKHALFYVLLGAKMPSVVVEASFISNPVEERRLRDPDYLEKISQGIFQGILKYIQNY